MQTKLQIFLSSKLLKDLDDLREDAKKKNKQMDKVIIVSEWTSLLDTVRLHLHHAGYSTVSITGM